MKRLKILIAMLITVLLVSTGYMQNFQTGEVILLSKSDKSITVRSVGYHHKKKNAFAEAQKNAFSVLLNTGLEGFNDGQPLVDLNAHRSNPAYFNRLLESGRYSVFIKESEVIKEPERIKGKGYKAYVQVTIYWVALERDLKANNITPAFGQMLSDDQQGGNLELPTIMVVPYKTNGTSYQEVLQNDFDRRIAVAKVQEGFNQKGAITVDFEAKLNATLRSINFEMDDEQTVDKQLLRNSGADVYVTVDVKKDFTRQGNRVALILKAYETASGNVLANKQAWSGRFNTTAMDRLGALAVQSVLDGFLNQISANFRRQATNGNTVVLNVSIVSDAITDLDLKLGNDQLPLSDLLRLWVKRNALNGRYHIQGAVAEAIIFDQIQIAATDADGNQFTVNDFAFNLWEYLQSDIGITCKKRVDGNTIYITIQE